MREIGKALNFSEDILKKFSHLYARGDFEAYARIGGNRSSRREFPGRTTAFAR